MGYAQRKGTRGFPGRVPRLKSPQPMDFPGGPWGLLLMGRGFPVHRKQGSCLLFSCVHCCLGTIQAFRLACSQKGSGLLISHPSQKDIHLKKMSLRLPGGVCPSWAEKGRLPAPVSGPLSGFVPIRFQLQVFHGIQHQFPQAIHPVFCRVPIGRRLGGCDALFRLG